MLAPSSPFYACPLYCHIPGHSSTVAALQQNPKMMKELGDKEREALRKMLWWTRMHNEYGLFSFLNYMTAGGRADQGLMEVR